MYWSLNSAYLGLDIAKFLIAVLSSFKRFPDALNCLLNKFKYNSIYVIKKCLYSYLNMVSMMIKTSLSE